MSGTSERDVRALQELGKRERLIMEYFLRNISVGEYIAVIDLKEEIKKRARQGETGLVSELEDAIIAREIYASLAILVKKNFLIYKDGVYRLADWLIDEIKKRKKRASPGVVKSIKDLLETS